MEESELIKENWWRTRFGVRHPSPAYTGRGEQHYRPQSGERLRKLQYTPVNKLRLMLDEEALQAVTAYRMKNHES